MHPFFKKAQASLFVTAAVCFAPAAHAIDLNDFRLQDVVPILGEMKNLAKLSSNQQALWLQVENKTKSIQRTRDERRQEIQTSVKNRLKEKAPELRDMIALMNQDDLATQQENKELREAWMGLYDALSDSQRDAVAQMLQDQLMRVADHPSGRGGEGRGDGRGGQGEGHKGRRGGGMSGSMGGGMGGGNPPGNGNM